MKHLRTLLVSVSALVSAIPGYKSIQAGIGTPPDYGKVFGGAQMATSALVILVILLFRADLERMRRSRILRLAAFGALALVVVAGTYLAVMTVCAIRSTGPKPEDAKTFLFPLVPHGDLAIQINKTSRQEVVNRYPRALDQILLDQGFARTVTVALLFSLHVTTFALLVALFAILGLRVGAQPNPRASPATD